MPIVYCAHLVPTEGALRITATDLLSWARVDVPLSGLGMTPTPKQLGEVGTCISSRQLTALVSSLQEGDTSITLPDGNNKAKVACGRTKAELLCLPGEEFPALADGNVSEPLRLPADLLCSALTDAVRFTSTDSSRPILQAVLLRLDYKGMGVAFVATDTHTLLQRCIRSASLPPLSWPDLLIPAGMAGHIVRMVKAAKVSEVALRILTPETGASSLIVEIGGELSIDLRVRLIEGVYPNYARVIPASHYCEWTLDRADFATALARVSIAAADNANRVVLTAEEGHCVQLSAQSGTLGTIVDEVEAGTSGGPIQIAASFKLIKRALDCIDSNGVEIQLTEPLRPIVIRPIDPPQPDGWSVETIMIAMPMQVVD